MTTKRDEFVKLLDVALTRAGRYGVDFTGTSRAAVLAAYDAASQPVAGEAVAWRWRDKRTVFYPEWALSHKRTADYGHPDNEQEPLFTHPAPKADAAAPDGWVIVRETVVEDLPGRPRLGYTMLAPMERGATGVFATAEQAHAFLTAEDRPLGWVVARLDQVLAASPARPEGAEKDAEDARRYRWLRHGDHDELVLRSVGDKGGERPFDYRFDGCWLPRNEKLDAAIDAAMSGSKGAT